MGVTQGAEFPKKRQTPFEEKASQVGKQKHPDRETREEAGGEARFFAHLQHGDLGRLETACDENQCGGSLELLEHTHPRRPFARTRRDRACAALGIN